MPDSRSISQVDRVSTPIGARPLPVAPPASPRGYSQWVFWVLAAVILLLGLTAFAQALAAKTVTVQVIIGLVLVTAVLAFLPRVVDVEKFQMGKGGMTLEMAVQAAAEAKMTAAEASGRADLAAAQADKATREAEEARAKLDRFIFLSMPKPAYVNLVKFSGPQPFGRYNVTEGFREQLRFLRDAGYITLNCYVGELRDGEDLSVHAQVTDLGREFIANRRRLVPDESL